MVNWDAVGAVGEVVSAVAVLATLIYLALQVRLSNRYESANHLDVHMDRIRSFRMELAANPDLSRLWNVGNRQEELDEDEQDRYDNLAFTFIIIQRDAWLRGNIIQHADPQLYLEMLVVALERYPGLRDYWERIFARSELRFMEEFRDVVNDMLS